MDELWKFLITALATFAVGQASAWAQHRRDQRIHEEDRAAARATFEQELQARHTEADSKRAYDDMIDWRERRLNAYRAVSTAASSAALMSNSMAHANEKSLFSQAVEAPTPEEFEDAFTQLSDAIDEANLISKAELRSAADLLWSSAEATKLLADQAASATLAFNRAKEYEKTGKPPPSKDSLEYLLYTSVEDATFRREGTLGRWRKLQDSFESARLSWTDKSRLQLGLPD